MKVFIISDIHGSLPAFKDALEAFKKEKADILLVCGDFLYHGPRNPIPEGYNPKELAILLNEYKEKIVAIKGNCDSEVDQMVLDIPLLDQTTIVLLSGKKKLRIFAHHGHAFTEKEIEHFCEKGTIIASGHTHIPLLKKTQGCIFVNPGSITLPKEMSKKGYALIEETTIYLKEMNGLVLKTLEL